MKKICQRIVLILVVLMVGIQVYATVVTTRERRTNETTQTTQNVTSGDSTTSSTKNVSPQVQRISNNLKNCHPYSESLKTSSYGMDMSFKISILGWSNDKCAVNFDSSVGNPSSNFESLYGVSLSNVDIRSFAPKVRCKFSKSQLQRVGDAVLQEDLRSNGGKMLKNPENIDLSQFMNPSAQDSELMNIVFNENACQLVNTIDLNNIMNILQ